MPKRCETAIVKGSPRARALINPKVKSGRNGRPSPLLSAASERVPEANEMTVEMRLAFINVERESQTDPVIWGNAGLTWNGKT